MNQLITRISLLAALTAGLTGAAFAKAAAEPLQVDAALDRPVISADKDESVVVQIKIRPDEIQSDHDRPPVNLSLVLDRSGSMQGDKIRQAIEAAQVAVGKLGPRDIVSVITYSDSASTLADSQYATRSNIKRIQSALSEVSANGSTAIYDGLNRGAAELRRRADEGYINRIVLLSDGLANRGPSGVSDFRDLARAFAGEDIVVSTVGLGGGFNEDIMTALAEAGQGNTYFVENASDLPRIFGAELGDALNVAATNIEIIITPREGVRIKRSLGREAEIKNNRAYFQMPQVYGGQDKLALLEIDAPQGKDGQTRDLVDVEVRYVPVSGGEARSQSVSVPIAYAASEVKIKESARVDVAQNVIDNRIAEAKKVAVGYADSGDLAKAATNLAITNDKIQQDYDFLGQSFTSASAEYLNKEEDAMRNGEFGNRQRKAYVTESYQKSNSQTVTNTQD
ncbi:vWA domain-containing protein [Cerasicoccus arenae]|nr:VWA domain-containing protein [Cerasicoccus arenae]MBK1859005.1 VWA domain-containing protein [Cerasicoccus arenae]